MPFVYLINPDLCNAIKIGKWSGSGDGLRDRYITYYGKQMDIYLYECSIDNYHIYEKEAKKLCSNYTIDKRCELLYKNNLEYYMKVCYNVCKTDYVMFERKKTSERELTLLDYVEISPEDFEDNIIIDDSYDYIDIPGINYTQAIVLKDKMVITKLEKAMLKKYIFKCLILDSEDNIENQLWNIYILNLVQINLEI